MRRTAQEVCAQAIIYGCLGFRGSLEVTEHPRSKSLCCQLLPWLDQLGLGDQVEPLHREILNTPRENLSPKDRAEAYWRGEAALFLGWALELFDKPESNVTIDPGPLSRKLRILQPTAADLLSTAKLRSQVEIDDYCAVCIAVRHQQQLEAVSVEAQATLKRIHRIRIGELGLGEAIDRMDGVEQEAAKVASAPPNMQFQYVARALTAEWLLGAD